MTSRLLFLPLDVLKNCIVWYFMSELAGDRGVRTPLEPPMFCRIELLVPPAL